MGPTDTRKLSCTSELCLREVTAKGGWQGPPGDGGGCLLPTKPRRVGPGE